MVYSVKGLLNINEHSTIQANLSSSSAFLIISVKLVRRWLAEYPLRKQNWWDKKSLFTWKKLQVLKVPFWMISRFWLGYYLDQLLCLFSLNLLSFQCPLVELEKGKLCFCFHGQGRISMFFCWFDNIFIYSHSNTCKKVIEVVGNFFSTWYYLAVN